jgi:hypothetical protein
MLFLLNASCASFVGGSNVCWFCLVKKVYIAFNDKQHTQQNGFLLKFSVINCNNKVHNLTQTTGALFHFDFQVPFFLFFYMLSLLLFLSIIWFVQA